MPCLMLFGLAFFKAAFSASVCAVLRSILGNFFCKKCLLCFLSVRSGNNLEPLSHFLHLLQPLVPLAVRTSVAALVAARLAIVAARRRRMRHCGGFAIAAIVAVVVRVVISVAFAVVFITAVTLLAEATLQRASVDCHIQFLAEVEIALATSRVVIFLVMTVTACKKECVSFRISSKFSPPLPLPPPNVIRSWPLLVVSSPPSIHDLFCMLPRTFLNLWIRSGASVPRQHATVCRD